MDPDAFGELRSYVEQPERANWYAIQNLIVEHAGEPGFDDEVRPYLDAKLLEWTPAQRTSYVSSLQDLISWRDSLATEYIGALDMAGLRDVDMAIFLEDPPALPELRRIELSGNDLDLEDLEALLEHSYIPRLEALSLMYHPKLGDEGLRLIAAHPGLSGLRSLQVSGCGLEEGLSADHPFALASLSALSLGSNALQPIATQRIAEHPGLRELESLDLGFTYATERSLAPLLGHDALPRLRRLSVRSSNRLGAWVAAYVKRRAAGELRALDLVRCGLTRQALTAIGSSMHLRHLEELHIGANELDFGMLRAIKYSETMRPLRVLTMDQSPKIGPYVKQLFSAPAFSELEELNLSDCELDDAHIELLCTTESLYGLERLNLGFNPFGDRGLRALIDSPVTEGMTSLYVRGCESESWDLFSELEKKVGHQIV